MGPILTSLVKLQKIERDLSQVQRRKRVRTNAVRVQQKRIDGLQEQLAALEARQTERRKLADEMELDLKTQQDRVNKLRGDLNSARTNKEYASVLTEINTHRADMAKMEEQGLKVLSEIDAIKTEAAEIETSIAQETTRMEETKASSADEVAKLDKMIDDLQARRAEATEGISPEVLSTFDRLAEQYDGEAMAGVERNGRRAPYTYVCSGCYMQLNAEHANALQSRDEVRQCDNCRRILYMTE